MVPRAAGRGRGVPIWARDLRRQGRAQDFAISALDRAPLNVSVKCEPELAVALRTSYAAISPGYHLDKRHWNTITLDGSLSDQLVRDLIEDSYDLIVSALPKRTREELGWAPDADPLRAPSRAPRGFVSEAR